MSKQNQETLKVYEYYAKDWISCRARKHGQDPAKYQKKCEEKKERVGRFLGGMSDNLLVLEVGSGAGDDIRMLQELGCRVCPSDGAQAFVDIMKEKGYDAFLLDVSAKAIPGVYDVVYANHVFIHMTSAEFSRILLKIYGALRPGGRFIFNVGNADGEGGRESGWVDLPGFHELHQKRYFHYWKNYHLIQCVEEANFVVKYYEVHGGDDGRRWIDICAIKL